MVYENPFAALNPLTPIASKMKNAINKGPAEAILPFIIITKAMINNSMAQPIAIVWGLIFFINRGYDTASEDIIKVLIHDLANNSDPSYNYQDQLLTSVICPGSY